MITIETPRLLLRGWREEDVAPMAAINGDPEVMRHIGDGSTVDEEHTRAAVKRLGELWDKEGFTLFAVEVRETGELAGFTGLGIPAFLPEILPAVEIGWRLGRPFWGRGLATEAARAAMRFGFRDRGLDRVVSIAQTANPASIRVMAKLGMRLDRRTTDPGSGRPIEVHAITRDEYARLDPPA
ncbi:GNAT family N-acetyltransferase [Thermocatellispora tengchongensis]|uniref:GNAT family N-acetyltransferase n=1 Tax=Thermocatellispora tengchongensis TaxID=1073253 RepID=UPI00363ED60B